MKTESDLHKQALYNIRYNPSLAYEIYGILAARRGEPPVPASVKKAGLTPRMKEVLDFIVAFVADNGFSPSFEEICTAVGLATKSSCHRLVTSLEKRGAITRIPGATRSIALCGSEAAE